MATLQLAVCGVVFLAAAPLAGGLPMPHGAVEWRAIAVTSIGCGAIAFVVQSWAQRRTTPARAAVILAGEPAFAALAGWLLAGDRIALTGWLGAALMLGAVFYVASQPAGPHDQPPTSVDEPRAMAPQTSGRPARSAASCSSSRQPSDDGSNILV
jgi:drug/metabolite transporter (DMT)-like permease